MKRWIFYIAATLVLSIIFFVISFPVHRIGPILSGQLEKTLSSSLRGSYKCEVEGLRPSITLGASIDSLSCSQAREEFFNFQDLRLTALPFHQSLSVKMGPGQMKLSTDVGFSGTPSKIQADLSKVELTPVMPIVYQALRGLRMNLPIQPEVEGSVDADISFPVSEIHRKSGHLKLDIADLKLPSQSFLELIGLTELKFDESTADLELDEGLLRINKLDLVSKHLSAKISGEMQLQENIADSQGDLLFKWKIQKSDALLTSMFGPTLANTDCPSPDDQGFCTRSISRFSEIGQIFTGSL
jgi:type II secretion system protein N